MPDIYLCFQNIHYLESAYNRSIKWQNVKSVLTISSWVQLIHFVLEFKICWNNITIDIMLWHFVLSEDPVRALEYFSRIILAIWTYVDNHSVEYAKWSQRYCYVNTQRQKLNQQERFLWWLVLPKCSTHDQWDPILLTWILVVVSGMTLRVIGHGWFAIKF